MSTVRKSYVFVGIWDGIPPICYSTCGINREVVVESLCGERKEKGADPRCCVTGHKKYCCPFSPTLEEDRLSLLRTNPDYEQPGVLPPG